MSYLVMPCLDLSCLASRLVWSCLVLSYLVLPCLVLGLGLGFALTLVTQAGRQADRITSTHKCVEV